MKFAIEIQTGDDRVSQGRLEKYWLKTVNDGVSGRLFDQKILHVSDLRFCECSTQLEILEKLQIALELIFGED